MVSILEQSQVARRNGILGFFRRKSVLAALVIVVAGGGAWRYFGQSASTATTTAQAKEWTVAKDDIRIAIESSGSVVAEDGVELSFGVSGDTLEVTDVYVKEGDVIKKGDKIAAVKTDTLAYSVRTAYASYQSALATYNEKIGGPTEETAAQAETAIEQAKLSLEQSQISLAKTRTSAADRIRAAEKAMDDARKILEKNRDLASSESVDDAYADLSDAVKGANISLETMLPESDEILGVDNTSLNDDYEQNIGAEDVASIGAAKTSYSAAASAQQALTRATIGLFEDSARTDIDSAAIAAKTALTAFERHLYDMQRLLDATIVSAGLNQSELDAFKNTIVSNRSTVSTRITAVNNALKAVQDAQDGLDDYAADYNEAVTDLATTRSDAAQDIKNAEANVAARELSLADAQRDRDDLDKPLTAAEQASARSQLTSASVSFERAQSDLKQGTLTSPIDGQVAMLNYKAGDIILKDATKPVVSIINNNTLFIEVNIEEADISKLSVGQKAVATFDALDGVSITGEVSFISLTAETSNNGVVTYLVRVLFEKGENQVREGMTASIEFITGGVDDVLVVPVAAVRNVAGKPSVQNADGQWLPVTTGYTDGKYVEVKSGVSAGDKIVY